MIVSTYSHLQNNRIEFFIHWREIYIPGDLRDPSTSLRDLNVDRLNR